MKSFKEAFDYYDTENKGYLTSHQLKCCVIYLTGSKLTKLTMTRLKEKTQFFSFQDLNTIISSQVKEDPATEIFNCLDIENKGYFTIEDFYALCDVHAKYIKPEVRESVFEEIDSNKDGMVTLRDIQRLVKFSSD
jgi:Ca2+-binding EF-hand superfamily protein